MTRVRILVSDPLPEDGLARLREVGEVVVRTQLPESDLLEAVAEADALVVRSQTKVTAAVLEAGQRLRVVGRAGVGVDNIDVEAATAKGILVVNAPRGNTIAAAEHAIGLLLAAARSIPQADASLRRGEWARSKFLGVELRGKTIGIVGLGNIGSEVAKRAQGFEMEVIAFDPVLSQERAEQFNVELVSLEDLMARADFISVHAPLTERTRNLIDERLLGLVKPTARLVNAARGGIVDEAALFRALSEGRLAAAAADVFAQEPPRESPLLTLTNFIGTPHIAASTIEAQTSVAFDVAEDVAAILAGELPRNAINAPSVSAEELTLLRPYVELAEQMATLYRQLGEARISAIEMEYEGEIAQREVGLLTAGAIKGLLAPFTEERINPVNARLIAAGRGLKLTERRSPIRGKHLNSIRLTIGDLTITGVVQNGGPRITAIGSFAVDLDPRGRFLISRHEDRPGVVGHFGTILGQHDINIASMQVGRDVPRAHAMMIMTVDDMVGEDLLGQLRQIPGMAELRYVEL